MGRTGAVIVTIVALLVVGTILAYTDQPILDPLGGILVWAAGILAFFAIAAAIAAAFRRRGLRRDGARGRRLT